MSTDAEILGQVDWMHLEAGENSLKVDLGAAVDRRLFRQILSRLPVGEEHE